MPSGGRRDRGMKGAEPSKVKCVSGCGANKNGPRTPLPCRSRPPGRPRTRRHPGRGQFGRRGPPGLVVADPCDERHRDRRVPAQVGEPGGGVRARPAGPGTMRAGRPPRHGRAAGATRTSTRQVADDDDAGSRSPSRPAPPRPGRPARRWPAPARGWCAGSRRRSPAWKCSSSAGVTSLPVTPRSATSASPSASSRSCSAGVQLVGGRHGLGQHQPGAAAERRGAPATPRPPARGRPPARAPGARSRGGRSRGRRRCGTRAPAPTRSPAPPGWPRTSRIDFTPEHTTSTGVRASAARSAETSQVSRAPRCTPPSPPVANSATPGGARPARRSRPPSSRRRGRRPDRDAEVADRELGQAAAAHPVQLGGRQPDPGDPVEHRDGGRHRAAGADHRLQLVGDGAVARARAARARAACSPARRRAPPSRSAWATSGDRRDGTGHVRHHGPDRHGDPGAARRRDPPGGHRHHGRRRAEDVPLRAEGQDRRERGAGQHGGGAVRRDLPGHAFAEAGLPGVPGLQEDLRAMRPAGATERGVRTRRTSRAGSTTGSSPG